MLYFVDLNTSNNFMLALDVTVQTVDGKDRVEFFDTNRGRGFEGKVLVREENGFVFLTESGDVMTFREATVEEFDLVWRRSIEGSVPAFRSDEDLHRWYDSAFAG
ncbi:hypothetical protein COLU111180_20940 [Cohnella lubricantis]